MPPNSKKEPEIPAMATAALARFGDRFDEAQREVLIKTARQLEEAAEDLRKWELANGDEPDSAFSALQGQDS
ncbi:MAG: hypothetical protein IIC92_10160 [Chloroflexi bacterium]|nr:hypothetical protein [Chloroflexota bacterium]MCH8818076.1 hypothetical protein [Chloroflexota bacterium]